MYERFVYLGINKEMVLFVHENSFDKDSGNLE